jgi:hypothetical protein
MGRMDFHPADHQGFVRVAACTLHTVVAGSGADAETVLRVTETCNDDHVAVAVCDGANGFTIAAGAGLMIVTPAFHRDDAGTQGDASALRVQRQRRAAFDVT